MKTLEKEAAASFSFLYHVGFLDVHKMLMMSRR